MRILITGGNGFIARNLREHLAPRHDLCFPGRKELDLLDAEAVAKCLKDGRFDAVIHAATYDAAPKHSTKDPAMVLENNLRMFFNLARCSDAFGKMIFFGSGAEFGREHWIPKMGEDYFDRHVPGDPYGFSKYIMTRHAMQPGSNIYNLRLFGVFGKYDDWRTRFIANACARAVMDMPIVMNQDRTFDYLWVGDLARIAEWFLAISPKHPVYNVCSGTVHRFTELARMICRAAGREVAVMVKSEDPGREYSGENSRLLAELGGFSFTPTGRAVAELYQWHEQHRRPITPQDL